MASFFYEIGRRTGKALQKGMLYYRSLFGSEEEALKAEFFIGTELANRIFEDFEVVRDKQQNRLLNSLGARLVERIRTNRRRFRFAILQDSAVNAFALPGGFIFCTSGLLQACRLDEDIIGFVLAHEIGHVVRGHPFERILTGSSLQILSKIQKRTGMMGEATRHMLERLMQSHYARSQELEADRFGLQMMTYAGFDPEGAARTLKMLKKQGEAKGISRYFASHPPMHERLENLRTHADC